MAKETCPDEDCLGYRFVCTVFRSLTVNCGCVWGPTNFSRGKTTYFDHRLSGSFHSTYYTDKFMAGNSSRVGQT